MSHQRAAAFSHELLLVLYRDFGDRELAELHASRGVELACELDSRLLMKVFVSHCAVEGLAAPRGALAARVPLPDPHEHSGEDEGFFDVLMHYAAAVAAGDPARARASLDRADRLVTRLGLNAVLFAGHSGLEAAIRCRDWKHVRKYVDAMDRTTAEAPIPHIQLLLQRARALVAHSERPGSSETIAALQAALAAVRERGLLGLAAPLEDALRSSGPG